MKKGSKIVAAVLSIGVGATILTGYSYANNSKVSSPKPKTLTESIVGHWKDQDGAEYFLSNKNFTLKDTDGSIRKFTYMVMVQNNKKNDIQIELKTVDGQIGVTRDITFDNKARKNAEVKTELPGLNIDLSPDDWKYVDNKTDLQ